MSCKAWGRPKPGHTFKKNPVWDSRESFRICVTAVARETGGAGVGWDNKILQPVGCNALRIAPLLKPQFRPLAGRTRRPSQRFKWLAPGQSGEGRHCSSCGPPPPKTVIASPCEAIQTPPKAIAMTQDCFARARNDGLRIGFPFTRLPFRCGLHAVGAMPFAVKPRRIVAPPQKVSTALYYLYILEWDESFLARNPTPPDTQIHHYNQWRTLGSGRVTIRRDFRVCTRLANKIVKLKERQQQLIVEVLST